VAIDVELLCSNSGEHLSQIYTGFGMLHRAGRVNVVLRRLPTYDPGVTGEPYFRAIIDRNCRVVYDVSDGDWISPENLEWCSVYFKRSYRTEMHGAMQAIQPLGLNYPVYGPGDWRTRRLRWSVRGLRPHNLRAVGPRIIRLNRVLSWVLRANGGCASSMIDNFEAAPLVDSRPRVVFFTRTWDPDRVSGEKAEEWRQLNEMRAGCIRALRKRFGADFAGGLAPTDDAQRNYPDCVADPDLMKKRAYLKTMGASAICVSTTGLRGSNPWRLAEYVAASRAIVTETLDYEVPGDFSAPRNYLAFEAVDECVEHVGRLLSDSEFRLHMMRANQEYYRSYVRPDALIARSLDTALPGLR
jgi:hypothetical protein